MISHCQLLRGSHSCRVWRWRCQDDRDTNDVRGLTSFGSLYSLDVVKNLLRLCLRTHLPSRFHLHCVGSIVTRHHRLTDVTRVSIRCFLFHVGFCKWFFEIILEISPVFSCLLTCLKANRNLCNVLWKISKKRSQIAQRESQILNPRRAAAAVWPLPLSPHALSKHFHKPRRSLHFELSFCLACPSQDLALGLKGLIHVSPARSLRVMAYT